MMPYCNFYISVSVITPCLVKFLDLHLNTNGKLHGTLFSTDACDLVTGCALLSRA